MPELLLELFSEEIPARMQARAAEDLTRLLAETLAPLSPANVRTFFGPRRIAYAAEVAASIPESRSSERGPRTSAPEQALAGFLRKHSAAREQLRQDGDYWLLEKITPALDAARLIADAIPALLRRFPWPKSMRWGGTSSFTWVRPLRRIVCLLDGTVVPFDLRDGADDGHGLAAGNQTVGHRFLAPGAFAVTSANDWAEKLRAHRVLVDASERRKLIKNGVEHLARERGLIVADDPGLLDEVAGLVEWPVPLIGHIDDAFMDLPPEVMQVSMRVNQRYFALRNPDGSAAPYFAFVANIEPSDDGAATIAGNERVLRARFSDARHFWDLDRRTKLADRVEALNRIVFHAKVGSQGARVGRLTWLAEELAPKVGADVASARTAALLAKADLTTGMVNEFPELQGVMGRYYALHDGYEADIANAIRDHYSPKGPNDRAPTLPVSAAVALADKIDLISSLLAVGEKPTGSGDPYGLRRAALGIIRIIRERNAKISLFPLLRDHFAFSLLTNEPYSTRYDVSWTKITNPAWRKKTLNEIRKLPEVYDVGLRHATNVLDFIIERLRVQLRIDGARHDILAAVFAARLDDDLTRLLMRTDAVTTMLKTEDGANLLVAYRRAANILRIEEKKGGPYDRDPDPSLFQQSEERRLSAAIDTAQVMRRLLDNEDFTGAMTAMADLRAPLDSFFDRVTVNATEPELRKNRLRLLNRVRATMDQVADFSRIEG